MSQCPCVYMSPTLDLWSKIHGLMQAFLPIYDLSGWTNTCAHPDSSTFLPQQAKVSCILNTPETFLFCRMNGPTANHALPVHYHLVLFRLYLDNINFTGSSKAGKGAPGRVRGSFSIFFLFVPKHVLNRASMQHPLYPTHHVYCTTHL